jgi:hypothetical protein
MLGELSRAVDLHQRTPIEEAHIVTPQILGIRSPSLFVQEAKTKNFRLSIKHYETLFTQLQKSFDHHEKGLIIVSTAKEADQLTQYLNKIVPGKTFTSSHALYKKGKVNFLVVEKGLDDPKIPGRMGLYVDLNRDFDAQRFLRGASHVLASDQNVKQAAIFSLAELTPAHAIEQLMSFEEAVQKMPSGKVRAELLELSTEMQRAAIPGYAPMEKAADETIEHIGLKGKVPNETGEESGLYFRMVRYRNHRAFTARIKRNPKAWKVFSDYLLTDVESAALELIPYFLKGKRPPPKSSLYECLRKFRKDPKFIAKIKEVPKAWEFFQSIKFRNTRGYKKTPDLPSETTIVSTAPKPDKKVTMAIEKAAQNLINHLLWYKEMPTFEEHRALYKSLFRYRIDSVKGNYRYIDDPALIAKLKANTEAWELFQKLTMQKGKPKLKVNPEAPKGSRIGRLSPPQRIAKEFTRYILENRRLPPEDSPIYERFHLHRDDPAFAQTVKNNPEAWELYNELILPGASPQEKAAQDFINYVSTTQDPLPTSSALYRRLHRYLGDPVLTARLQKNAQAWERFQTVFKRKKVKVRAVPVTPSEAAQQIIVYMLKHKDVPPPESALFTLFDTYRDDPVFIKTIKQHPEAWEIFSRASLSRQEKAAYRVITYISQTKTPLTKNASIYKLFYRYRKDPIFIAKLKENSEVCDFLKKTGIKLDDPNSMEAPAP